VVVDKTADMAKKAGAEITDAWITTNIKARMLDEDTLDGSNIDVDTDRRVVTLSGTVTSEAGRKTAVDIVKRTDGVERIVDRLTMAPKK
jgi:osmotically-inducible protein OsmY